MTDKELEEYYNKCIQYTNMIKNSTLKQCCQKNIC